MRKNIENQKAGFKKTHIHDVKKYLRKHGLIRVGTAAPNDVTRTMYEDANSAGNIYNRSPEVLRAIRSPSLDIASDCRP